MSDCLRCNQPEQYGCGCTTQEMNDWRADEITRLTADLATARRDAWERAASTAYDEWMNGTPVAEIPAKIRALIDKDATP